MWPAACSGLARSKALRASTSRASACTMALLAWAMAAVARAMAGVVLGELGIERVGDEPGQHVALLHAHAFVGQHLGDAQAFDLGPDQDLLARHQRAGGQHGLREVGRRDAGDRHGRGQRQQIVVRDLLGARLGRAGRARQRLADQRQRDHQEAERKHAADQYLSHGRPLLRGLVVVVGCWREHRPRHRIEERADQLQHGRHDRLADRRRDRRRGARTCRRRPP